MRNRRPADMQGGLLTRVSSTLGRSPAERLEPTRPPVRPRRYRPDSEPPRSSGFMRFLGGLFSFLLLLMLILGGVAYLFNARIDAPGPLEKPKVVVIPKGEAAPEIAVRLEREGVVSDRRIFMAGYLWSKFAAWLEGTRAVQLKAGDYDVRKNASIRQVVEILSEGRTVSYKVTVPEGLTSYQIVERLKADGNLSGEIAEVPPEGTLLPETFIVQRASARQAIIDGMLSESRKLMEKAWASRRKDLPLKTWEEAVVLASIVEKETGRNDERERVAAVFINRLRQNMRLQSDPTILYGMFQGKTVWNRPIQRNEIGQKTAHNTYQVDGLPPTPICNPGRAAIEAVLNPADTKELYFVADGSGGHVFSETLKDHNANVVKWRAAEKEIKGKAAAAPSAGAADTPATPGQPQVNAPPTRAVIRKAPQKDKPAEKTKGAASTDPQASTSASTPATAPTPSGSQEVLPWAKQKR
jgi:UPF0755 protein